MQDKGLEPHDLAAALPKLEEALYLYGRGLLLENFGLDEKGFEEKLTEQAEELGFLGVIESKLEEGAVKDEIYDELSKLLRHKDKEDEYEINSQRIRDRLRDIVRTRYVERVAKALWLRLRQDFPRTDLGNGERFVAEHMEDVRYCAARKVWYRWTGKRWAADNEMIAAKNLAKETVRRIRLEAQTKKDDELLKHWKTSDSSAKLNAILKSASIEPKIQIRPDEFDQQTWLLNCENGTVNLKGPVFTISEHQRTDFQTRLVPVPYKPKAECPHWMDFLARITGNDQEFQDFMQWIIGYSLSGETSEKCLFFLLGVGDSGKTTFLETLQEMMGPDYATSTDFNTFVSVTARSTIRNDIARLQKKRIAVASEAKKGQRFDKVVLKRMTGGAETILARFLFKEYEAFQPEVKIFLGANEGPIMDPDDDPAWNRFVVVPFDVQVPEEEKDKRLRERFRDELPGILSWAIVGARRYYKDMIDGKPMQLPRRIRDAIEKYRASCEDFISPRTDEERKRNAKRIINQFIEQSCETAEGAEETPARIMEALKAWCAENRADCSGVTEALLGRMLGRKGYMVVQGSRSGKSMRIWTNIRVKTAKENP